MTKNIKDPIYFKTALSMYLEMDDETFKLMQWVINDHIEHPVEGRDMDTIYMYHAAIEVAAKIRFDYANGLGEVLYET